MFKMLSVMSCQAAVITSSSLICECVHVYDMGHFVKKIRVFLKSYGQIIFMPL